MTKVPEIIGLPDDHREALEAYAEVNGRSWKKSLIDDFYSGRDDRFRGKEGQHYGSLLRSIRNHPEWGPALFRILNS